MRMMHWVIHWLSTSLSSLPGRCVIRPIADAELAPFAEHSFENLGGHGVGVGGGIVVRFFDQTENGEGDVGFVAACHFLLTVSMRA